MLGMVTYYHIPEHLIIGGEIGDFCSRIVEGDSNRKSKIFVVRYNKLGVFVIAEWIGNVGDAFVDVMNLGKSLANFDRKKAYELKYRMLAPSTCKETELDMLNAESNFHHQLQDDNSEEQDRLARVAMGE
ncbi:hypothetical protein LCGC14_0588660 [marine sediment metagenome]|uniref:Uncharacterized protein n=1 Tax=marine sediment metagenome TaxID=412755 RepID=A0A0F9RY33_9ZZZZ